MPVRDYRLSDRRKLSAVTSTAKSEWRAIPHRLPRSSIMPTTPSSRRRYDSGRRTYDRTHREFDEMLMAQLRKDGLIGVLKRVKQAHSTLSFTSTEGRMSCQVRDRVRSDLHILDKCMKFLCFSLYERKKRVVRF